MDPKNLVTEPTTQQEVIIEVNELPIHTEDYEWYPDSSI